MSDRRTFQQANRDEKATIDSFKVARDGDGNLIPIDVPTQFGIVSVIPQTFGDSEAWAREMKGTDIVSAEKVAEQLRTHIASPDMTHVTGTEIRRDFKAMAIKELVEAIAKASGMTDIKVEVNEDGSVKIAGNP